MLSGGSQPHALQQSEDPPLPFDSARGPAVQDEGALQVVSHLAGRVEGGKRILKDDLHAGAVAERGPPGLLDQHVAVLASGSPLRTATASRAMQPHDRALARAGGAHQRHRLARP